MAELIQRFQDDKVSLKQNVKDNCREQELAGKDWVRLALERRRNRTELCRELEQVRAKERRPNNTKQCREVER